jgi:hypothetical protein
MQGKGAPRARREARPAVVRLDADAVARLSTVTQREAVQLAAQDAPERTGSAYEGQHLTYCVPSTSGGDGYAVELMTLDGGDWRGTCTCQARALCKHLVAAAMVERRDRSLAARPAVAS